MSANMIAANWRPKRRCIATNGRYLAGPFYGLRHTYATLSLEAGGPIEVVSKRLRHASIAITAGFCQHVTRSVDGDAADALAGLIFGGW